MWEKKKKSTWISEFEWEKNTFYTDYSKNTADC